MADYERDSVKDDLTGLRVNDRLAKVAVAYTHGQVEVVYGGSPATDSIKTIILPTRCKTVALGTHEAKPGEDNDFEALTWAYLNHEMGHLDVEFKLRQARRSRVPVRVSAALRAMIPDPIRHLGFDSGDRVVLPSEFIKTEGAERGRALAAILGGSPDGAFKQIAFLANVAEDPRQEAMTSSRWKGAAEHLAYSTRYCKREWRRMADDIRRTGQDRSFKVFAIVLIERLTGSDTSWAGEFANAQADAVADIIETYRTTANYTDAMGFYDAVNFALAVVGRVYRKEAAIDPPTPACPSCGSVNLRATLRGKTITLICKDCGHTQEQDIETSEDATPSREPFEGSGMEVESDEEPPASPDEPEASEPPTHEPGQEPGQEPADEDPEGEGSPEDGEAGESEESGPDEGGDSSGDEGEGDPESTEDDENEGSGSGSNEESDHEKDQGASGDKPKGDTRPTNTGKGPLRVGSIIRPRGARVRFKVTAINPDGSVQAEPV